MVSAVKHGDGHVGNRELGQVAFFHRLDDALFYAWNVLAGNGRSLNLIEELIAAFAFEWFNPQLDFSELPAPTGLLLVTVLGFGFLANRLFVGNLGSMHIQ